MYFIVLAALLIASPRGEDHHSDVLVTDKYITRTYPGVTGQ